MVLVSEPFDEGDCVAVRAVSASNPTERKIELPVSILAGWEDQFLDPADPTASELGGTRRGPGHPNGEKGPEQEGHEKSR
jgi:hypothetical protein